MTVQQQILKNQVLMMQALDYALAMEPQGEFVTALRSGMAKAIQNTDTAINRLD